jgi:hypothetical protein
VRRGENVQTLSAIVGILSLAWVIFTVWWMVSTAGSLRRVAEAQESMLVNLEVEAEFADDDE